MDYEILRERMVREQLMPRGIHDPRVLEAFSKLERHRFIPEELRNNAYADHPVAIGEGQTISQPYIVALMTQSLDLKGEERVLEIGTGSGYQTAILAELAQDIYSVERFENLAKRAQRILDELRYKNIRIKTGDGTLGWEEAGPFDRIIVTAAAPKIPELLASQLNDAGKLVLPLGEAFSQVLTLVEKKDGVFKSSDICGCVFVPLVGKYGWPERPGAGRNIKQ